jgi:hypothetical protein
MEKTMVLYPGLAVSHFVPMMRLASALVEHGYAVFVALIDPAAIPDAAFSAVVATTAASMPSVRFHTLALVEDPPRLSHGAQFIVSYFDLVRRYNDRLHDFLRSFTRVHAVVVDSMSALAIVVTKSLGIPGYLLFTSSAASLAAFAQLPYALAEGSGTSFKELGDTPVELFGLPPIPASHLLGEVLEDPAHGVRDAVDLGKERLGDDQHAEARSPWKVDGRKGEEVRRNAAAATPPLEQVHGTDARKRGATDPPIRATDT